MTDPVAHVHLPETVTYFLCLWQELFVSKEELKFLCDYYFDGKGKAIRPMIVVLMARALNIHSDRSG